MESISVFGSDSASVNKPLTGLALLSETKHLFVDAHVDRYPARSIKSVDVMSNQCLIWMLWIHPHTLQSNTNFLD